MKKTLLTFVVVIIVSASVILAGCQKETNFHKQTADMATEFYQTEQYNFLFDENVSIQYPQSVQDLINEEDPEYSTLKNFYDESLRNFTFMFASFQSNLSLAPQNTGKDVAQAYKDFEDKIENLKQSANNFDQAHQLFVSRVEENPASEASRRNLKTFKTHYKELLYSAKDFHQSFESLYTQGFMPYPTTDAQTVQPGTQKLVANILVGKLTTLNLEYMFDDNTSIEHAKNSLEMLNQAKRVKQASLAPTNQEAEIELETLIDFLETEKVYNTETNHFTQSLEKFELSNYYLSLNQSNFLKQDNNQLYFNKINSFIEVYSSLFVDELIMKLL